MSADRERQIGVIERIAEEAKRRALDPKNVAKGGHWRELSMEDLTAMFDDEANEFWQELMPPCFQPNGAGWESGDLLVVMAMMLDKMETGPRYDEERRRGRPLGAFHGSDSPALDRRMADAPKDRPPGYRRDLHLLHRYANEGVRSQGAAMRFVSLRRYPKEYAELAAEAQGQGEFL